MFLLSIIHTAADKAESLWNIQFVVCDCNKNMMECNELLLAEKTIRTFFVREQ